MRRPGLAAIGALVVVAHRSLDALLAGDDAAVTLGVNVTRFRQLTFLVCAFATASFVALSGVIGFIGLMVPHLARGLVGPLHGALMLTSAVIGAALLLTSDIAARTLLAPQEFAHRRADHLDRRGVRAVPGASDAVMATGVAGFAAVQAIGISSAPYLAH